MSRAKGKKLTPSQELSLRKVRDHGDSAHGLKGNAEFGGWTNTATWLRRHGLTRLLPPGGNVEELTEYGRAVLSAGRLIPRG